MQLRRSSNQGITLVELLIGTGVFLLFLGMVFFLYIMGFQSWRQADTKLHVNREGIIMLEDLAKELAHSSERSVRVFYYTSLSPLDKELAVPPAVPTAPFCAISFLTPFNAAGTFVSDPATNEPIWQAYLIYYCKPDTHTILKKRVPVPAPLAEPEPIVEVDLINELDGAGILLASDVTGFRLLDVVHTPLQSTLELSNPLCVQVIVEKASIKEDKPERVEALRLIQMYN